MENTKEDKFAREVLNESIPEWINPDFNKILMDKIRKESRKRKILSTVRLYFLMFVSIDAILVVLLNFMHVRIGDISTRIKAIYGSGGELPDNTGQFIFIYFIVLLAVILFINMISSNNNSFSRNKLFNGEKNISPNQ